MGLMVGMFLEKGTGIKVKGEYRSMLLHSNIDALRGRGEQGWVGSARQDAR